MLRPATSRDVNSIAEVLIQSRRKFLPFAPLAHSVPEIKEWIESKLIPSKGVSVWEVKDQVVAFIATSEDYAGSWIDQLYVLPNSTGIGIGHKLLDHAHRTLRRPISLYTFQQNSRARQFYERAGYKVVKFTQGESNEEKCPDVLYSLTAQSTDA